MLVALSCVASVACAGCKGSGDDDDRKSRRHRSSGDDDDDDDPRDRGRGAAASPIDQFLSCPFGLCGRTVATPRATCEKLTALATASFDSGLTAADRETIVRSCTESMTSAQKSDAKAYTCTSDCIMQAKDMDAYTRCSTLCAAGASPPPAPPPDPAPPLGTSNPY